MAAAVSIGVMVLGLLGIIGAMFITDRELKAKYGYGGQKALAQAEKDGIVPPTMRLVSRLSGGLLALGTFALITKLF
jgi:hypothetical protein